MKVVSLVPSWTEMLIECGVNVVGRTRFCVHPENQVDSIAVVGGTKDLNWEKMSALNADLLILDQEENLPWMQEDSAIPVLVTHVTSVASVANEIEKMAQILTEHSLELQKMADRWSDIARCSRVWDWKHIPGEMECLQRQHSSYQRLIYVIWKNPWMRVSRPSFIASVLETLGAVGLLMDDKRKYPEFQLSDFNLETTYFLFSSEPFPFHQKKKELMELGIQGSIVDGECYSWFGLRSLLFLENAIGEKYTDPDKSKSTNC
ncbi:MAG: ABC transporter substrate-binding protein [Pseudobdellovibrionaceae bacterium]